MSKSLFSGVLWWLSWLRIHCCQCYGMGSVLGLGIPVEEVTKKKKKKNNRKKQTSFFFFFLRATSMAHGHSQARGWIGAAAAAYTTTVATMDPSHIFKLHCSSWQHGILNPLSRARDWTRISWILVGFLACWATNGNPPKSFFSRHFST